MSEWLSKYKDINLRFGPSLGVMKCNEFEFNDQLYYCFGVKYQRVGEKYLSVVQYTSSGSGLYSNGGSSSGSNSAAYEIRNSYDLYYDVLKLPLLIEYRIDRIRFYGGVNIAYILSGKFNYNLPTDSYYYMGSYYLSGSGSYDILTPALKKNRDPKSTDKTLDNKQMDYTLCLGIGYKINCFGISLTYEGGLRFLDKVDSRNYSISGISTTSPFGRRLDLFGDSKDGRIKPRIFSINAQLFLE